MGKILPLVEAKDTKLVGGKAKALGELIKAGFNVPAGFVITTKATADDFESILEEFDKLGTHNVAVRSSAVAEDGSNDAWAGQMDTFLNVKRDGLKDAVEKCWRSAGSARAKAYAEQKGLNAGKVAVIVQKMVPATVSGVSFSAHPVTSDKNQIVIEAVDGLAEKLVSGVVTPDTYVLDKKSHKIAEKHLVAAQILSDQKIVELAQAIVQIENHFNFPVDVEWSFAGDELFILQSRPVTTLG